MVDNSRCPVWGGPRDHQGRIDEVARGEVAHARDRAGAGAGGDAPGGVLSVPAYQGQMMYPLVLGLAAPEDLWLVGVAMFCLVLRFFRQVHLQWCASLIIDQGREEAQLVNADFGIHVDDPTFGY